MAGGGRELQDGGEIQEEVGGKGGGGGHERREKRESTLTVRFLPSTIEWAKHRHVMATLRARHKLFPKRDET